MISKFKSYWTKDGDVLTTFDATRLSGLDLQPATVKFLTKAGLPRDAAPFLSFARNVDDTHEGISRLTSYHNFLDQRYARFIVIGSDESANQIAINTALKDQIEWLNHEDFFSSRYMNRDIHAMAWFLVFFRDFIHTITVENGQNAYLDSNFTNAQFNDLRNRMTMVDSRAISEDGFWKEELELLLANREEGG